MPAGTMTLLERHRCPPALQLRQCRFQRHHIVSTQSRNPCYNLRLFYIYARLDCDRYRKIRPHAETRWDFGAAWRDPLLLSLAFIRKVLAVPGRRARLSQNATVRREHRVRRNHFRPPQDGTTFRRKECCAGPRLPWRSMANHQLLASPADTLHLAIEKAVV